jgi:GNAT superfamily N-acetyltransferase
MVEKYLLVKNEYKYFEFIRTLRNDKKLLDGFIDKTYITPEMQTEYMKKHEKEYYICLNGDIPIGFIGVVNNDLRLAVDTNWQRKGVGTFMLQEISKIIPNYEVRVLPNNKASLGMFKSNGFKETKKDLKNGVEVIILEQK